MPEVRPPSPEPPEGEATSPSSDTTPQSTPTDPRKDDWLGRHTPIEWIHAALAEVSKAEEAFRSRDARAGVTACKRAAGMGLNAALIVKPNEKWGRRYVDHVVALSLDDTVPVAVREAAEVVVSAAVPSGGLILLRTRSVETTLLEATRDVIAHAYAVVRKHEPLPPP